MHKQAITLFLSILVSASSWAQGSNILSRVSPKLRTFLIDHPPAIKTLTNAFTDAFSSKTVRLMYFYSDDDSQGKAFHYYPNNVTLSGVIIAIRENQPPLDEFITLLFETVNSKGENRFAKICEDAKGGTISRAEFTTEILKVEFEAMKATSDLLIPLKLGKKEKAKSYYYELVVHCPREFGDFFSYEKKDLHYRDVIKHYELQYDQLRKMP